MSTRICLFWFRRFGAIWAALQKRADCLRRQGKQRGAAAVVVIAKGSCLPKNQLRCCHAGTMSAANGTFAGKNMPGFPLSPKF